MSEVERGVGEVLIDAERLQARIRELGRELTADYAGRELLLVGVLKGAVFFMADLMRRSSEQSLGILRERIQEGMQEIRAAYDKRD